MPLNPTILSDKLREFMDKDFAGFIAFPTNELDAAAKWANAIDAYTGSGASIIPPSTTGVAAKAALQAGLSGMSLPAAAMVLFDASFLSYATTLGTGMAPAFVGAPPPIPISITLLPQALLALPPNPAMPSSVQVPLLASIIDVWFRTGTATPSIGGSPVPWS